MIIVFLGNLISAAVVGTLAALLLGQDNTISWNIFMGILGAVLGTYAAKYLGFTPDTALERIAVHFFGACILVSMVNWFKK